MNGPEQEPKESSTWNNWQDYHAPGKSKEFDYSDSTREHIGEGEQQKFHYEGNDLPDKG
jgi:hypothetical protein